MNIFFCCEFSKISNNLKCSIYIYIHITTEQSSGSSSDAPTNPVVGAPGWPGRGAADRAGRDAAAATAAAAAVCCSMIRYIYIYIYMYTYISYTC